MDKVLLREVCKGFLTYVPAYERLFPRVGAGAGGGTLSAEYCYAVWMKHITLLLSQQSGMGTDVSVSAPPKIPKSVAELGPGDTLGAGFAFLLAGANEYSAFDVVQRTGEGSKALPMFDALHALLKSRLPHPEPGWPNFDAYLDENQFPSQQLPDSHLQACLQDERIASLRQAVTGDSGDGEHRISYVAPWSHADSLQAETLDLVYSHSVLEYMDDLDVCYRSQWQWLKPGGYISHQIDLTGHSLSSSWDGFRGYNELTWKLVYGKRPFGLNRQPCSAHVDAITRAGFDITLKLMREQEPQTVPTAKWSHLSDEDRRVSGLFIQARKPV